MRYNRRRRRGRYGRRRRRRRSSKPFNRYSMRVGRRI